MQIHEVNISSTYRQTKTSMTSKFFQFSYDFKITEKSFEWGSRIIGRERFIEWLNLFLKSSFFKQIRLTREEDSIGSWRAKKQTRRTTYLESNVSII